MTWSVVARREVYRRRWEFWVGMCGEDHPTARAAFGRYVAARGGALTLRSSGPEAFTAWSRYLQPGYLNRRYRKHLTQSPS